jgi:hypothetical protein
MQMHFSKQIKQGHYKIGKYIPGRSVHPTRELCKKANYRK